MPIKTKLKSGRFKKITSNLQLWLKPGIGIKRWVLIVLIGSTFVSLGIAVVIIDIYRGTEIHWLRQFFNIVTLFSLPRWVRAVVFGGIGTVVLSIGIWKLNSSILKPFLKPGQLLIGTLSDYKKLSQGPRVVAIGGGNGLASLLRGLKKYTHNLTAIVTVADDGGSSGELRKNLGILPPGDIRNCLTALADDEEMLSQVFRYRFGERAGVNGHSLGNLFISALTDITGSFEEAVAESGRVLAVRGRVLPSTLHDVKLVAEIKLANQEKQVKVVGESIIPQLDGTITHLWLDPDNPSPFPPSIQAILNADLIIIGPGSLYTSVLPNLLVPGLAEALKTSRAIKFLVCNVANQRGETMGYTSSDHIQVIEKHTNDMHFDIIICNNEIAGANMEEDEMVVPDSSMEEQYSIYFAPLVDPKNPCRHDSLKLAEVITDLYFERTGPLTNRKINSAEDDLEMN
jgi:uncharacterized cofD-like protein